MNLKKFFIIIIITFAITLIGIGAFSVISSQYKDNSYTISEGMAFWDYYYIETYTGENKDSSYALSIISKVIQDNREKSFLPEMKIGYADDEVEIEYTEELSNIYEIVKNKSNKRYDIECIYKDEYGFIKDILIKESGISIKNDSLKVPRDKSEFDARNKIDFNKQFSKYLGKTLSKSDVKSFVKKVIENNSKKENNIYVRFSNTFARKETVSYDEYCYDKRTLEEAIIRNGIHIIYVDGYDDNGRISYVSVIPMLVEMD